MNTDVTVADQAAPNLRAALLRIADPLKLLIDGKLTDSGDGRMMERVSPAHGVVVAVFRKPGGRRSKLLSGRLGAPSMKGHGHR